MYKSFGFCGLAAVLALQGCVVAPPPGPVMAPAPMVMQPAPVMVAPPPAVMLPPGVVYIAPGYPAPSVGFVWEYHARYGWGWRHPQRGWHRGWR
ncbi:MAG: hypothetical protein ACKOWC_09835 [Limnohabitans sp.]